MKIKHSKYKNTGILFELLTRQLTVDTIAGDNRNALSLIKKYLSGDFALEFRSSADRREAIKKLKDAGFKDSEVREFRNEVTVNKNSEVFKKARIDRDLKKQQEYVLKILGESVSEDTVPRRLKSAPGSFGPAKYYYSLFPNRQDAVKALKAAGFDGFGDLTVNSRDGTIKVNPNATAYRKQGIKLTDYKGQHKYVMSILDPTDKFRG